MSPLTHPIPAEWLTAYADGELDRARQALVDAHLPACAACRAELEALRALSQTLAAAELPPAAFTRPDDFWRGVQARLPEQGSMARPPMPAVSARRVLLHWSPGIGLLALNALVQVAAVAAGVAVVAVGPVLARWPAPALAPALAWAAWGYQLAAGSTLGWLAWLVPANWGGWALLGLWLTVSAELAVLYLAWLGYEWRYGAAPAFGRAAAAKGA